MKPKCYHKTPAHSAPAQRRIRAYYQAMSTKTDSLSDRTDNVAHKGITGHAQRRLFQR